MVGIPGSSKGCTTCKRRKVRCDLKAPYCARCTNTGRKCEGYVKDWRQRLVQTPVKQTADTRITFQPSGANAFDNQIISLFWERYIPSTDESISDGSPCLWLQHVISAPSPPDTDALQLSVKALAITRLGRMNQDDRLALQGQSCYVRALQLLQKALRSDSAVGRDETFAAGYVLALHELFESESLVTSMEAWKKHMTGLEALVSMRGPQKHRSPFGRALLEEFRASLMISCIQDRRTSALASATWLARDWDETCNSLHPTIYDKGLVLASLLEEIDNANLSSASDSTLFYFLQRCLGMDTDLDIWYEEFVIRTPSSSYWPTPTIIRSDSPSSPPGPKGQPRLSFANLSIASTTTTFWALKIIISNTIATACSTILSCTSRRPSVVTLDTVETSSADPDDVTENSDPSSSPDEITAKAQRLSNQYNFAQRKDFATLIVRSMPYCLNFNMGLLGPQRAFFALRTALGMLRSNPSPEQRWVKLNHKKLSESLTLATNSFWQPTMSFRPVGRYV